MRQIKQFVKISRMIMENDQHGSILNIDKSQIFSTFEKFMSDIVVYDT